MPDILLCSPLRMPKKARASAGEVIQRPKIWTPLPAQSVCLWTMSPLFATRRTIVRTAIALFTLAGCSSRFVNALCLGSSIMFTPKITGLQIHRFLLERDSSAFSNMFSMPQGDPLACPCGTDENPLVLYDDPDDFRALCWIIYAL
jgi:hypothetical protein